MKLRCGDFSVDLSTPVVMGVINVTPDSFSDGGRFLEAGDAIGQGLRMVEEGAAIIDVGGESSRPGAEPVSAAEELRRVAPVIRALVARVNVPVSIDTCKVEVMRAALDLGATLVNDVRALRDEGAPEVVARTNAAVCLMHMLGEPRTMQHEPRYGDVVEDVREFLAGRARACEAAGVGRGRIVLDPGFGFGKTVAHNLELLRRLDRLVDLGYPVLAGLSRKSMIGTILGRPVEQRLHGGLALAALAVANGARIVRSHDVAATVDAVRIAAAVIGISGEAS
jgi:dihydropteroate synthase